MSSKPLHPVLQEFRQYVTAADETRYDTLPEGFVRIDVTHSNLQQRWHDILIYLDCTILEVKEKLYRKGGSIIDSMELFLRGGSLASSVLMDDDTKTLRYYGCRNGCDIHIKDNNPHSISAGGALENVDLVEKYVMPDEDYEKRSNSLRNWIKQQKAADPNFKFKVMSHQGPAEEKPKATERPATPDNIHSTHKVGERCEIAQGKRRGSIAYVGKIHGCKGTFIGVHLDEPQGMNDGCGPDGKRYFECQGEGYGCFVRPENVSVGDFPARDPFASDSESSEDEI